MFNKFLRSLLALLSFRLINTLSQKVYVECQIKSTYFNCRLSIFFLNEAIADEIKIAVASNFYPTMKELVTHFESITPNSDTTNNIVLISGSSGKHYAQILNGAPFDLFFSADKLRPNMLEKEEVFNNQSGFT